MTKVSCRHCKSPYRFNPCWWPLVAKNYRRDGGDPPCMLDCEAEQDHAAWRGRQEELARRDRSIVTAILLAVGFLIMLVALTRGVR